MNIEKRDRLVKTIREFFFRDEWWSRFHNDWNKAKAEFEQAQAAGSTPTGKLFRDLEYFDNYSSVCGRLEDREIAGLARAAEEYFEIHPYNLEARVVAEWNSQKAPMLNADVKLKSVNAVEVCISPTVTPKEVSAALRLIADSVEREGAAVFAEAAKLAEQMVPPVEP
jgi:hypothetical protein